MLVFVHASRCAWVLLVSQRLCNLYENDDIAYIAMLDLFKKRFIP